MSMVYSSFLRSPCELIREINDDFQGDSPEHKAIREKLAKIELMTKNMSKEIVKTNPNYYTIWKESNGDLAADHKRRTSIKYKYHKL